ncbi:DUF6182 family protein [Streptomyces sp. NPDC094149]|uniref:DUF6182 family protein n=1 Tax=Streptomyces sp. NPDC094149 TaxID=3155079 RepID=UPI0033346B18
MSGAPSTPMGDAELLTAARARVERARSGLGGGPASSALDVAVVVADLDVTTFIGGIADFALSLPHALRDGWYRTLTRTVFLAGRPASTATRHPYRHTTPRGDLAWYGPARRVALRPLSLLLRAFQGPAQVEVPAEPLTVVVPGTPTRHTAEAAIAVGGVSTVEYLVHVHHLISEAVLRGLVRSGDTLRVEHRQTLTTADFRDALDPGRAESVQTRIAHDGPDSVHLRLYGVLVSNRCEETTE